MSTLAIAVSAFLFAMSAQVSRRGAGIAEGQPAADFTLKLLKSEKTFKLSSNFGTRPTVLIFGSYT